MPSTLVSSVLDITLTAWMEDKLFFKMYKRGKLMMKKIFIVESVCGCRHHAHCTK